MTAPAILNTNTASNSTTITVPSGVTSGQLIVVSIVADTNSVVTISDGAGGSYTEISTLNSGADGFRLTSWYKVSAGSDSGATLTFSTSAVVICQVWGGADSATPIGDVDTDPATTGSSPFAYSVPALTTTIADSVIYYVMTLDTTSEPSTTVFTVPTGFTNRYEPATGTFNHICVSDKAQASIGTTGTLTATATATVTGSAAAIAFIINPTSTPSATLDTLSSPVAVGGTGYSGTTSNMAAITSLTNATITSASAGSFSYSMNSFSNGVAYLPMGSQTFTAGDLTDTGTKASTVQTMPGYTSVLLSTMDTGEWSLGKDPAFISGNTVHLPTAAGTLNTDGTLTDYVFGSYSGWMQDQSDTKMYSFTLTVTNSGVTTSSDKMTTQGITEQHISVIKITE